MRTNRVIAAAAASLIAATGLVACSSETDTASSSDGDTVTVKIGTTDADLKAWSVFADEAQKDAMRALVAPVEAIFLDAKFEAELVELDDDEEAREMLAELGIEESGLDQLARVKNIPEGGLIVAVDGPSGTGKSLNRCKPAVRGSWDWIQH